MENPWWNFACSAPPFATDSWDLSPCFQQELSLVPFLILAVLGAVAFPSLASRYRDGDLPEKGGKSAYSVKVVCTQPSSVRRTDGLTLHFSLPEQAAAGVLVLAQLGYLITVITQSHHIWHDVRLPFGILALTSYVRLSETRGPFGDGSFESDLLAPLQVFALALHIVSHPIVPHSSTPLLFWSLSSLILAAIALRSALIRAPPSSLPPLRLALFVFLTIKLSLFGVLFIVELFGPDGWDQLTARDLISWLPGVSDQGRIRLDEQEAAMGATDDEWTQLECPRLRANIFSRLTFSWLTPM